MKNPPKWITSYFRTLEKQKFELQKALLPFRSRDSLGFIKASGVILGIRFCQSELVKIFPSLEVEN